MFAHPFAYVMVATFIAAVLTMLFGIAGLGRGTTNTPKAGRSNQLMFLRVGLCALLLLEIIYYITVIKPTL
jgi:hypothetical protein